MNESPEEETVNIQCFDTDSLLPKSVSLIIGDAKTGKTTLIKDIIKQITINSNKKIKTGIACVDSSQLSVYKDFIEDANLYKRYSTLLASRCYADNSYMILDYYFYNKEKYTEILENANKSNVTLLISLKKFPEYHTNYDYVFITKLENLEELVKVYETYIKPRNYISLEQFVHLLNYLDKYEILSINCKAKVNDDLFYSYLV